MAKWRTKADGARRRAWPPAVQALCCALVGLAAAWLVAACLFAARPLEADPTAALTWVASPQGRWWWARRQERFGVSTIEVYAVREPSREELRIFDYEVVATWRVPRWAAADWMARELHPHGWVVERAAGWPLPMLRARVECPTLGPDGYGEVFAIDGIWLTVGPDSRVLPFGVVWSGVLVNGVVWSLLAASPLAIRWLRRRWRLSSGRCPRCAYPLLSGRCSECGFACPPSTA